MPKQFTKNKIATINFKKKFKSFAEIITEFKNIHPEMAIIFNYDEYNNVTEAIYDIMTYVSKDDNIPSLDNKYNLSLNVSINRVELKTNKFFSFKWDYKYDRNGDIVSDFYAVLTIFKGNYVPDEIKDMEAYLEDSENGWEKFELNKKPYDKNKKVNKNEK